MKTKALTNRLSKAHFQSVPSVDLMVFTLTKSERIEFGKMPIPIKGAARIRKRIAANLSSFALVTIPQQNHHTCGFPDPRDV